MRKLLLATCLCLFIFSIGTSAAPAKPTLKVLLLYKVSDAILQCQNPDEDMLAGREELEKELLNHYNKRFIVQGIKRVPFELKGQPSDYMEKYSDDIKNNQKIFLVIIELKGQGQSTDFYQNAYGAKAAGVAPTVQVQLIEAMPDTGEAYDDGSVDIEAFYLFDYGIKSYGAGTFSVGKSVYAAQTNSRINTKNAVRATFRDACKFDGAINKYANPVGYEIEHNRFTGNFKANFIIYKKMYGKHTERIDKFKKWCEADEARKPYLSPIETNNNFYFIVGYIDSLIKMGVYKEN